MHSPNMFLHRYAFLFSLLIVIMALETLSRWNEIKTWHILTISLFLILGFLSTLVFGHYKYVMTSQVMLTFLFGLAYLILSINSIRNWISNHLFVILLFIFMTVEAGVNALYQVQGVQKEWNFASRDYYNTQVNSLEPIANKVNELSGSTFARTDNTVPDTANDGMKYNFNALSQFSSVRNSNASSVMRQLGFHTDSTYLNLRYPGNTILMDSIFAIKYNISQAQPPKFGFSPASNSLSTLTQNSNAIGLGVFVPGGFKDAKFTDKAKASNFINNQTALVNALTQSKTTFFTPFYTTSEETSDKITGVGSSVTLTRPKTSTATDVSVTYGITADANSQLYLSVPNITYLNSNAENTLITISDVSNPKMTRSLNSYYIGTNDTGSFFNLGSFTKETKLKVTLSFPENSQVTFDTTSFWRLDTQTYQKEMALLKSRSPKTETIKNGVRMTYNEKEKGDIFLTIPYDKGWSAKIDGKKVPVSKAQDGFTKVAVPAGKHQLELKFFPNGLKEGIICFILGILLFIGYNYFTNKHRKAGGQQNES